MSNMKYPHLFEPIVLAGQFYRNRIFASPTGYQNMTGDGILPREAAMYYGRKAKGGAASVATCELIVDKEYGTPGGGRAVYIENEAGFMPLCRVANEITRFGAVATAELTHCGMYANKPVDYVGGEATGIAYGPVETVLNGRHILEMPEEIIERTIGKFADAAKTAQRAGFQAILIHAGHGWMFHQFLAPQMNTRTDKWGGPDIENRARFLVETCDAIRRAVGPRMPIEVRISGSECYTGGYGIEEGIKIAKQLDGHCSLIHVSCGSHENEEAFTITHPRMFLGDGPNVQYAAEIKKHVETPVATIGAIGEPEMMEEIIASGKADVVEMARSLIADPDLPNKIMAGKENEIRPCMRCLLCFVGELTFGEKYCAINPESGHEGEVMRTGIQPAPVKKRVLVVGGGVGGMEAAIRAAQRGHEVILCEKNGDLGGNIRCERYVPFKRKLEMYINTQITLLKRYGVEIRLNTEVTPEYAKGVGADVIIAALGARPVVPTFVKGYDLPNVMPAEYAYLHADEVGENVVILGAGLVGLELAVYLSMKGKKVRVVELLSQPNDGGNFMHGDGLKIELKNYGVELNFNTKALEFTDKGIIGETAEGVKLFEGETCVYAVGMRPLRDAAIALREAAPEFFMIGDCVLPKNILNATTSAYETALNIGQF